MPYFRIFQKSQPGPIFRTGGSTIFKNGDGGVFVVGIALFHYLLYVTLYFIDSIILMIKLGYENKSTNKIFLNNTIRREESFVYYLYFPSNINKFKKGLLFKEKHLPFTFFNSSILFFPINRHIYKGFSHFITF